MLLHSIFYHSTLQYNHPESDREYFFIRHLMWFLEIVDATFFHFYLQANASCQNHPCTHTYTYTYKKKMNKYMNLGSTLFFRVLSSVGKS